MMPLQNKIESMNYKMSQATKITKYLHLYTTQVTLKLQQFQFNVSDQQRITEVTIYIPIP